MSTTPIVTTTGAIWNLFYSDKTAWPDGTYHDDTLLAVNGKENPDGELERLPLDATVEIRCGYVMFPDGTAADLGEHFAKWQADQAGLGVAMGSFRVGKSKLQAVSTKHRKYMRTPILTPVSEEVVKMTAKVVGPQSAAAQALTDADRRRQAGETVTFFKAGRSIFVRGAPASAT